MKQTCMWFFAKSLFPGLWHLLNISFNEVIAFTVLQYRIPCSKFLKLYTVPLLGARVLLRHHVPCNRFFLSLEHQVQF